MVTPRKPGAKRGRPRIAWRNDPDRYAVAFLDALIALEMAPERRCALLAAAIMLGKQAEIPSDVLQDRPDMVGIRFDKIFGPEESTATLEGRAAALREKRAKCDPASAQWRIVMGGIFMLVIGAKDRIRVGQEVLVRAAAIGEEAFAHKLLLHYF